MGLCDLQETFYEELRATEILRKCTKGDESSTLDSHACFACPEFLFMWMSAHFMMSCFL